MKRQRKLTPAQRRVLRQIVADVDDVMSGGRCGFFARRTGYRSVLGIRRKLTVRGYAVHEFRQVGDTGHFCTVWPTPKGLAALDTR